MIGIYDMFCKKCNLITKWRVININRKTGIRVKCLLCDSIRYVNAKRLEDKKQNEA